MSSHTQRISFVFAIAACGLGTLAIAPTLRAESLAAFYANRQMAMLIGTTVGGGYDLFGRMIARHMGRHLPGGTARFVVRNMPGAGGVIAANHVFNVAERDGSTIATVTREIIFDPLLSGDTQSRFDARRFLWLGSPNLEVGMIYVSGITGIDSLEQARQREVRLGTSGASRSINAILPKLLNELIGTKFKVISGYPGSMDVIIAMERGEVDGRYSPGWAGPEANKVGELVAAGKARLLAYLSPQKSPALAGIPHIMEFARGPGSEQILTLLLAPQALGRPFFAPPGIAEDRAKALQDAFAATMTDAEFQAEAAQQGFEIAPTLGAEMARFVNQVYATPKPLLDRAIALVSRAQR